MAHENFHILQEPVSLEELCEVMAKLQKTLRHVINGNIDFTNVRAKSLTAETIDVDKLSAIAADLGHITAGLIDAVQIFGSYIATSRSYPRVEFSSTDNLLRASTDTLRFIEMYANQTSTGSPSLEFRGGAPAETIMYQTGNSFRILAGLIDFIFSTAGQINLSGGSGVRINSGTSLDSIFQPSSSATTVPALVSDFNTLLSNLRAMNILA